MQKQIKKKQQKLHTNIISKVKHGVIFWVSLIFTTWAAPADFMALTKLSGRSSK
jgi:hypothetical protein